MDDFQKKKDSWSVLITKLYSADQIKRDEWAVRVEGMGEGRVRIRIGVETWGKQISEKKKVWMQEKVWKCTFKLQCGWAWTGSFYWHVVMSRAYGN